MITIRSKLAPTWFKLGTGDPPAEFQLAPLSSAGFIDIRNELARDEQDRITISGNGALAAVRESVRDWRNVVNEKGEEVPFDRALLAQLPPDDLIALASEIVVRSMLSGEERKN